MLKPPMPNVPGMTDSLEFVKNLWGSMNIPGVGVPGMAGNTLSTEDLDKKITDLKAVESWLNMNIGMLRGTIQALEVQRGTIATLKTMGESMAQAMGNPGGGEAMMAPFTQFFTQAASAAAPANPAPPPPPAQPPQPASAPTSAPASAGPAAAQAQAQDAMAGIANAAMPAAVAWWNLLQDQFRQAVSNAIPAESVAKPEKTEPANKTDKAAGSPLDVSGGAPADARSGNGSGGNGDNHSSSGNSTSGRGTRARSKADKG
ncbi:PhaM family polyhydroxyalkanoate granule multifunctional regulatory protein [Massilia niastensis]|uniref:PhaM family polyhydroxyalkanoate granule multifunctional regulatory protein n=1 Tax=Massilia niastensis TaxID=544911 RepID=UPI0003A50BF2|nr:PhaM family polyhydroxyalkanoate granule multifunctional regulatory protein [Massilia niastensis]